MLPRRTFLLSLIAGLSLGGQVRAADPCADHVPQVRPQNASRDVVGQDLDAILDQGFMTFAVYEDHPPYSWEDSGKARGVDVDIARLIADDIGVEARFVPVAAGENLDADLRNWIWQGPITGGRVANVMMRIPYDSAFACRAEQVVFTGQYAAETIAIAYSRASYPDAKPVPAYFRFDTVGVENDSIADFYLSSFPGGQLKHNVRRYPDMATAMKGLGGGEVMAVMGPLAQIEHGLGDGLGVHRPPLPGFAVGTWTLGVAVNFRYRPLAYAVDDAVFAALQDGRIAGIFESYGLSHLPPER